MTPPTTAPTASPQRPWSALIAMCLGLVVVQLDRSLITSQPDFMLPGLRMFGAWSMLTWAVFPIASTAPLLMTGRLGDLFGARRMYLLGLTTFCLAGAARLVGASTTSYLLIELFQGLGVALLTPQVFVLIARRFDAHRRGIPIALVAASVASGVLFAPWAGLALYTVGPMEATPSQYVDGGPLQSGPLPLILAFAGPVAGLVVLALVRAVVPPLRPSPRNLPPQPASGWPMALVATVGLTLVLVSLNPLPFTLWFGSDQWGLPLTMLGLGVLLLVVGLRQHAVAQPSGFLPSAALRSPRLRAALVVGGAGSLALASWSWATPWLPPGYGPSEPPSAWLTLLGQATFLAPVVLAPLLGWLASRYPAKWLVIAGFAGFSWSVMILFLGSDTLTDVLPGVATLVTAVSLALVWVVAAQVALAAGPADQAGARIGLYYAAVTLGQSLGWANSLLAPRFAQPSQDVDPAGSIIAMFALPTIVAVIAIAVVAKRRSAAPTGSFDSETTTVGSTHHDGPL